jgi:hypothetical protein
MKQDEINRRAKLKRKKQRNKRQATPKPKPYPSSGLRKFTEAEIEREKQLQEKLRPKDNKLPPED